MNRNHRDYTKYSFEDFLLDDYFIESLTDPTGDSIAFWTDFANRNASEDYRAARKCIEDANRDLLDEGGVDRIWKNIQMANKPRKIPALLYYAGAAAAAGIAVFMFVKFHEPPSHRGDMRQYAKDIIAFSNQYRPIDSGDIRLIVSDDLSVTVNDSDDEIIYGPTSILAGSSEIPKKQGAPFHQLVVPNGKRSALTLSDGTKIRINSGSRVVIPVGFGRNGREIFLDGEIYLDVAHDNRRPFVVKTGDITVQVLGTRFNIQTYSEDAQKRIILESGKVKISSGTREVVLKPNQMYERDGEKESVKTVDVASHMSWINGVYAYEKERLDVILTRLSRYYGKEIEIDPVSSGLRCTGKLNLNNNIDEALKLIRYTAPIHYTVVEGRYVITHKPKLPMEEKK